LKGRDEFKLDFVKTNDIIPAYSKKAAAPMERFSVFSSALYVSDCRASRFCAARLTG
jgi:hypothetical protein